MPKVHRTLLVAALIAMAAVPATPAAAAAGSGYVRLAHLSPDTPAVDVYLSSQGSTIKEQKFDAVGYGVLSDYMRLPAGDYAVAMRTVGAPRTEKPVLTTQVTVSSGEAYTVAGVGRYADLGLRVIDDDLALPETGKAKIRIVQASIKEPVLDVGVKDGAAIADGVAFATTTDYREVNPGTWTVSLRAPGDGTPSTQECAVTAGSVYSLLVLDGPGGLKTELRRDAGRQGVVPAGGVATGAGGTSRSAPVTALAGLAVLAAAGLLVARRSRQRP